MAGLGAPLALTVAVFLWYEAAIEVEILCHMLRPGTPVADARAILDTGTFLRVDTDPATGGWTARPSVDPGNARCRVTTAGGRIVEARFTERIDLAGVAARVGAAVAVALALFQGALAAGAPWGRLAWGGRHPARLPPGARAGSLAAAVVLLAGAGALLQRGGVVAPVVDPGLAAGAVGLLTLLFAASIVGNRLSRSRLERRVMTPVAVTLAVAFLLVALSK